MLRRWSAFRMQGTDRKGWEFTLAALLAVIVFSATGSIAGDKKDVLESDEWPRFDLKPYSSMFIEDCTMTDPEAPTRKYQDMIQGAPRRIADFLAFSVDRGAFPVVERRAPREGEHGLVVRIDITEYAAGNPGGALVRTSSRLGFTLHLRSTDSNGEIGSLPVKRLSRSGAALSREGSGGMPILEKDSAIQVAAWLSLCKGMDASTILAKLTEVEQDPEPKGEHATVYILRPQGFMTRGFVPTITVDDTFLGVLEQESYFTVYLPAGDHHVSWILSRKHYEKELHVEAGKTYYIEWLGWKVVNEKTGKDDIEDSKLLRSVDITKVATVNP